MRGNQPGGTLPLVLLVGLGALTGVAAWLVLSHSGHPVRPWLVVAMCVTGGVIAGALRVMSVQVPSSPTKAATQLRHRALTDRERGGVGRQARYLESAIDSVDRFDLRVRPQLTRLADHALRRRYGIDLRFEPERAREILGDSLWQVIRTPPTTPPPRRQVAEWVTLLEQL